MLLKDTCTIAAQILAGDMDENLSYIEQAVAARKKNKAAETGLRKGAVVTYTNTCTDVSLRGKQEKVVSVNKKTFSTDTARVPLSWLDKGYVTVNPLGTAIRDAVSRALSH